MKYGHCHGTLIQHDTDNRDTTNPKKGQGETTI